VVNTAFFGEEQSMKCRLFVVATVLLFVIGSANAQTGKAGPMAKLQHSLVALFQQHAAHVAQRAAVPFSAGDPLVRLVDDRVIIDAIASGDVNTLKADRGSLTALNPVTNKLYVSASTGTDPSVIDLATKSSTTIHAGTEGNALSVNVKANKIYFVGYEDNFLTVVDGVPNEPARIDVPGFHQWDSAFNETNGLLYLPTPNNNAITVIDTRTGVVSMVGTGSVPMAAAVNEVTNRIYVTDNGNSRAGVSSLPRWSKMRMRYFPR